MIRTLRPHQEQAIPLLRQSLASGKRRPILQAPTGAGKTLLAAAIIEMALNKGNRVIFTVPRIDLVDQTVDAFMHEGIVQVGVLQQAHEMTDPSRPVQVASVDTLARREIPPAGLVIIDEAHMMRKFIHDDCMKREAWQKVPFIGLSATPWAEGLGKHYDDLIIISTTKALIEQGYLSPFRCFAPSHPDLSGVKSERGDYVTGQLSTAMRDPKLVADAVQTWLEKAENRPTLCFAVDRAHAKHLQQRFEAAGVPTGYVDCHTPREERQELARRFRSGEIRVACSVGVLTTGIDWDVRCISMCRPTKSEMLWVQMIGRGLRTASDKKDCLILDHSDNTLRLGFVTDIHYDGLNCGKVAKAKKKSELLPRECPKCGYLKAPKVKLCPSCGFEAQHMPAAQEVAEGELVELTPSKKINTQEKADLYGQLKAYARRRNYNPHWADHKFREATGVWPNAVKWAPEIEPTPAVLNWIKSRQIAWVKGRAA